MRKAFDSIKTFKGDTKLDKILTAVLILSIVLAISMMVYVIVVPKEGEKFTEFYVLGPSGKAEDYPTNLTVGDEGGVFIGAVNHEYAPVTYQLEVRLDDELLDQKSIELMHNETWEDPCVFRATKKGDDQMLEFILFKNHTKSKNKVEDMKEPYRSLNIWLDVKKPNN